MSGYLSAVKLKGYKSIKDTQITFKPGLNIIIGKNGTGKTNFLSFLNDVLNNNFSNFGNIDCDIEYINESKFNLNFKYEINEGRNKSFYEKDSFNVVNYQVNDKDEKFNFENEPLNSFLNNELNINCRFNKYEITKNEVLVDTPLNIDLRDYNSNLDLFLAKHRYKNTHIVNIILEKINFFILNSKSNKDEIYNYFNHFISDLLGYYKGSYSINLNKYTPVSEIRLCENFSFTDKKYVNGLILEYKINNDWYLFNQLSDGTKRILKIIFDIHGNLNYKFAEDYIIISDRPYNKTILLEEPELGIHPHQLYKLMEFIKEESDTKQIIITTHSPQVLDILRVNELDRIIIADYTQEEGTKLRHLTKVEREKAAKYITNEANLSDYWLHSDLEK